MTIWKLSLKTDHKPGYNPLKIFQQKKLIGVGWHDAYTQKHPKNLAEAKMLFAQRYVKWKSHARTLMEKVQQGDFIWIHQSHTYYLCRVTSQKMIFGKDIDPDFVPYDLGHAREVDYVTVPEIFVSGRIQRGVIARRTLQKIKLNDDENTYVSSLYEMLKKDPSWYPDLSNLDTYLANTTEEEFFRILSPDDTEDIVAAYLQSTGWVLVKSTCFHSKATFEFEMLNRNGEIGYLQVKTGKKTLSDDRYKKHVGEKIRIFFFTVKKSDIRNDSGIEVIKPKTVYEWTQNNSWALSLSLRYRLSTYYESKNQK
jgi:hypothetical protein